MIVRLENDFPIELATKPCSRCNPSTSERSEREMDYKDLLACTTKTSLVLWHQRNLGLNSPSLNSADAAPPPIGIPTPIITSPALRIPFSASPAKAAEEVEVVR